MGGTLRCLPEQPLPPPGELAAEGTHVPGVSLSSESPAGAAVSLAGLISTRHDRHHPQTQRVKRGPSVARAWLDPLSHEFHQPKNLGLPGGGLTPGERQAVTGTQMPWRGPTAAHDKFPLIVTRGRCDNEGNCHLATLGSKAFRREVLAAAQTATWLLRRHRAVRSRKHLEGMNQRGTAARRRVEEVWSQMEARSAPILHRGRLMFPTLMHLSDDGEAMERCVMSATAGQAHPLVAAFILGRGKVYPRTLAPATFVPWADRQHELPFSCFPDTVRIWDGVSRYIRRQIALNKGVTIPGLGTFCLIPYTLPMRSSQLLNLQRPIFQLSENFAWVHGLQYEGEIFPGKKADEYDGFLLQGIWSTC
ncbi:uncharacterized protein LOC113483197 isoform X1 [Athene cunicularia]|uniref:uncharacterized protein LOC113483197 isoform X1 n=1 Tax=Athene cunicularia TaxID=194338 RepID=UPI000EF6A835|nr:uncharacterized protein LOC113483197 isoform X1 [Athene cunicularia]